MRAGEMEPSDQAPPVRNRGGRPRGQRVVLKKCLLYEETHKQLQMLARANGRSLAKEMQARIMGGEIALAWFARHTPEESQAECERLVEMVGDEQVDRATAKEAVMAFLCSPIGRVTQIAGQSIMDTPIIPDLAKALAITTWEAAQMWLQLVTFVLPYIHPTRDAVLAAEARDEVG
jgi:hypothetical protein